MTLGNAPDPPGVRAAREQPTIAILPTTYFVNFQLAAGVWILQTLPAVFLGVLLPRLPALVAALVWLAVRIRGDEHVRAASPIP